MIVHVFSTFSPAIMNLSFHIDVFDNCPLPSKNHFSLQLNIITQGFIILEFIKVKYIVNDSLYWQFFLSYDNLLLVFGQSHIELVCTFFKIPLKAPPQ